MTRGDTVLRHFRFSLKSFSQRICTTNKLCAQLLGYSTQMQLKQSEMDTHVQSKEPRTTANTPHHIMISDIILIDYMFTHTNSATSDIKFRH